MICIDALRADVLFNRQEFCNKYQIKSQIVTPNLDWLLDRSLKLTKCINTSPYTTASHASIFTGYWPKNNSVKDFFKNSLTKKTIYDLLHDEGYETFFKTDFPFILGEHLGFKRGVDHYYIEDEIGALTDFSNSKKNKFVFFHFADVHWPYGFHRLDDGNDRAILKEFVTKESKANNIKLSNESMPGPIEAIREEQDLILEQNYRRVIDYYCDKKKYDTIMAWYAEGVSRFDGGRFSKFMELLKQSGFFDDPETMIVIFADHGENWSDESYGHFNSCDLDVIRVPVLIHCSSIPKESMDKLARTIDLVPTIMEYLNIKKLEKFDGVNLFSNDPKNSITQSYVSDFKELVSFFGETKENGNFLEGQISSFLLKEATVVGNEKLEIKYNNTGKVEYRKSSTIENGMEKVSNRSFENELGKYLTDYDQGLEKNDTVKVLAEKKILSEFKNLGYFGGKDEK